MRINKIENNNTHIYYQNKNVTFGAEFSALKEILPVGVRFENQQILNEILKRFPKADKESISSVYQACVDPNGCINDYAIQTLYKILQKPPVAKQKNIFNDLFTVFGTIFNNSKKETVRYSYHDLNFWNTSFIEKSFDTCRDKNGYLNKYNLSVLERIYNSNKVNEILFPSYLEACKDKNGIFDEKNIEFLDAVLKFPESYLVLSEAIGGIKNKPIPISEAVRNIVLNNKRYFADNNYLEIQNLIGKFLLNLKGETRDELLEKLERNLEFLIRDNTVKYSYYDIAGLSHNNLNERISKNLDYIIEIAKNEGKNEEKLNVNIITDNDYNILDENVLLYNRLRKVYGNNAKINPWHGVQGFKTENGIINKTFVELIERQPEITPKKAINILGYKSYKEVFGKYEGSNLYLADNMLSLLLELKSNDLLKPFVLEKEIGNYGELLFIICDVVKDTNPKAYQELIKILKSVNGIHFNESDKNHISFLEKIINSENSDLLKLVIEKKQEFQYSPILEYAYEGIQNEEFKTLLKSIKIDFTELESTAHIGSIKAFDLIRNQLDSPFCKRKETLNTLYKIAKANNKKDYMKYLETLYGNIFEKNK